MSSEKWGGKGGGGGAKFQLPGRKGGGAVSGAPKNFKASFRQQIPKFLLPYKHMLEKKRPREPKDDDGALESDARATAMAEYKKNVRAWATMWFAVQAARCTLQELSRSPCVVCLSAVGVVDDDVRGGDEETPHRVRRYGVRVATLPVAHAFRWPAGRRKVAALTPAAMAAAAAKLQMALP